MFFFHSRDLSFQAEITFVDKNTPNDDGFTLTLSLKLKYDEFAKIVGDHLKYDYLKLQFFRANVYDLKPTTVNPNQSIKYNQDLLLKDAFNLMGKPQQQGQQQGAQMKKLFYQKLNIKISELEERRQFKCVWVSTNLKVEKEIAVMPFKKATVKELLNECKNELINLELIPSEANAIDHSFKLRLAEVVACKMHRIFKEDVLIETLETSTPNKVFRVEQIPVDELNINVNNMTVNVNKGEEFLLGVAHFTKEIYATFGTPFFFKCKQGELFKDIKQRIQKKLDVSDKEFATVRFFFNSK